MSDPFAANFLAMLAITLKPRAEATSMQGMIGYGENNSGA